LRVDVFGLNGPLTLGGGLCLAASISGDARMAKGPFTIGLISETLLIRHGLADLLRRAKFNRVVHLGSPHLSTENLHTACLRINRLDLVFFDLHSMEHASEGLIPEDIVSVLRSDWPGVKIVGLGTLLELGAHSDCLDGRVEFTRASPDQLVDIAQAVADHGRLPSQPTEGRDVARECARWRALSPRERQVLSLLGCGSDNLKIAAELTISESSIKGHVSNLLKKFEADNRSELALIARAAGLRTGHRRQSFRRD